MKASEMEKFSARMLLLEGIQVTPGRIQKFGIFDSSGSFRHSSEENPFYEALLCPVCSKATKNQPHLLFHRHFSCHYWSALLSQLNMSQVFGRIKDKVFYIFFVVRYFTEKLITWINASKAFLLDIWSERNQSILYDKSLDWMDHF